MRKSGLRIWSTATAGLIALAFAGSPANAFELFGIKLWGSKDDKSADQDVIGVPQHYTVTFNVTGDKDLDGVLKGASGLWSDRDKAASGAAGLLAKARSDYKRLLATLYGQARYGGSISILVDGKEAAGIAPDATLPDPASIVVNIDTGPLFHFREARIDNAAPVTDNPKDTVALPGDEGFRAGEIAESGVILKAERLSIEAWRQLGYPKARVAGHSVEAAHDQDVVDAEIDVDAGAHAVYGATAVQGTERMDPAFVAYMANLPEGQEFDPDDVDKANKRLSRLDVFRSLRVEEADSVSPDGTLPMNVVVQERPLHRYGFGATYSTIDGGGVEAYWMHRNLFGHAERLRFEGKVAGIGQTIDPRDFTYRLAATFTRPGVFTPDTDFVTSLIGDREVLDAYTRNSVTAQAGFTHMFNDELTGRIFGIGGVSQFEDDYYGRRRFAVAGLLGGLNYDSRDNKADATRGFYLDGEIQPLYEFEYGNFVSRFVGEARTYVGFGEDDRVVAAGRVKVGSVFGAPISQIPPDQLFFAGGGGSVRGYGYRTIGVPVGNGDDVVGGRSLLEASAELRVRATKTIGIVGFVDAGFVGAESFPDFQDEVKIGVGAGLRYMTGLGPIRLDVATPLNRSRRDPTVALYVGIGQAF